MPGLRVAVDVTPLLGVRTGVKQCVEHLLRALPAVAPDIVVVPYVLSRAARGRADELPFATRFLRLPAGVAIRTWGFVDHPRVDRVLHDVDVVHGTNFVVPPTRRPRTVTVHDAYCLVHPSECDPAVRPFKRAVGHAIARGAWVHVSTRSIGKQIVELYDAPRVARVPFGVPALGEAGRVPRGLIGPYILAISQLDARKRHEHLVRAFRTVASWNPSLQLAIAGPDGNAKDAVERAIKGLPADIARRVFLLGRVDEPTRVALLRNAAVLAYPSADEGFGFPVLEAMSAGVPVVATRVGGLPEVTAGAAVLIPVEDDPGALVEALRRVVTDEDVRTRLVRRGHRRVGELTWDDHARGMAELWRRAAA